MMMWHGPISPVIWTTVEWELKIDWSQTWFFFSTFLYLYYPYPSDMRVYSGTQNELKLNENGKKKTTENKINKRQNRRKTYTTTIWKSRSYATSLN